MTTKRRKPIWGGGAAARLVLAVGMLMLPLAACEDILEVEDPDIVLPEQAQDSSALPAILAAAIGDFAVAYSAGEGQILHSGLLADEWIHSGTFPTRAEVDIRQMQDDNATLGDVTRDLYTARTQALNSAEFFAQLAPNTAGHAEATNLAGFTYVFFGENYCTGVPFSQLNQDGSFTFGPPESTDQILQRALDTFDQAIEIATAAGEDATDLLYLAQVGKARTLMNFGPDRYAEAAATVAGVPTVFSYGIEHSDNTGREENGVFGFNWIVGRWSVADNEGINGLPYRSHTPFAPGTIDPRTPWLDSGGNGFNDETHLYLELVYPGRSTTVPLATGVEARLIEAEAALAANDPATMMTILNDLRANALSYLSWGGDVLDPIEVFPEGETSLPELTDPGTQEGRVDLLFAERAYWLWLTSHRLGDLRRLVRDYGRAIEETYPTGEYHRAVFGGVYGDDVALIIPIDEGNNPSYTPCDNTIP